MGFAEFDEKYYYNAYATLVWSHGDRCLRAPGKNCFSLEGDPGENVLVEVTIPRNAQDSYAMAKTFPDGLWVIVDLKARQTILKTKDFGEALARWKRLGFASPRLVDVEGVSKAFKQTADSEGTNHVRGVSFLIAFVVALIVYVLSHFGGF